MNPKCPYYLHNLSKVDPKDLKEDHGKTKYKLHYIYREFTVDFFAMDLNSLPKNASSLKFSKHNAHVMSLCLTLHINLGLSLRKTSQALKDLYNIRISLISRLPTIVKQLQSVSNPLSIITTIRLATFLLPMKPISKYAVSKLTFGSSWTLQAGPLLDIRFLAIGVLVLVSLPCGWLSVISQNSPKALNSLRMDTVPIR